MSVYAKSIVDSSSWVSLKICRFLVYKYLVPLKKIPIHAAVHCFLSIYQYMDQAHLIFQYFQSFFYFYANYDFAKKSLPLLLRKQKCEQYTKKVFLKF